MSVILIFDGLEQGLDQSNLQPELWNCYKGWFDSLLTSKPKPKNNLRRG